MKPRTPSKLCHCPRCKAGRRIQRITAGLSKRDALFLMGMFEALMELAAESNMREVAGKKRPRYSVHSQKLRGEPRIYFVVDDNARQFTYPNSRYASAPFTTAAAAESECLRLCAGKKKLA